ncbi:amidohydrolase family protein [Listeria monocytogenes]|nr:amidohydrolase family protein [Listeria monocytogenes]
MIIDNIQHIMFPIEMQVEKLEKANVDKAILFCTTPHPERVTTYQEFKQEMNMLFDLLAGKGTKIAPLNRMKKNNHEVAQAIQKFPDKFYGFGSVPLDLSLHETTQWIEEQIIHNHFKGIGEFTPGSDDQIYQLEIVFQALEQFPQLPVWVHTFNPVTSKGLKILMDLTKSYPNVPVIFGHMGGYHWMDVIDFVKETPNAYIDLSAAFSTLAVKMALTELPDQCLFGSDAPYGEPFISKELIEFLAPSKETRNKVLGENILNLIGEVY